eukprot:TRINITY_DN2985_c0_g2_i1.p1 TRINITY_DN2985_c0_g2~~TRINITY_DN2985_c0_g2_i1.p1  ORF type:complete len:326 (+),score=72.46 TRINITY_DN2985_c0_g2_i1:108-1085(+)
MPPTTKSLVDYKIADKFKLVKKIGSGAFGDIYHGVTDENDEVAVKAEHAGSRYPQLEYEYRLYRILTGGTGFPYVRYYGSEFDHNFLVMDLLGPSLEDLFNCCGRRFSLKTVLMLADQMLLRIEYLHSKCFIHRDIKPDNFLMGVGKRSHIVYMIDLGLAKKFRDPHTHQHIPYRENKSLTGTARYASVNAHMGAEQSRRDDLEALGYVLVYFLKGSLPWQGLNANTKQQKYEKIGQVKMSTSIETLCKGLPHVFSTFLMYCRSLRFEDKPDYAYCRKLFRDCMVRELYSCDFYFDWIFLRSQGKTAEGSASTQPQPPTSPAKAE